MTGRWVVNDERQPIGCCMTVINGLLARVTNQGSFTYTEGAIQYAFFPMADTCTSQLSRGCSDVTAPCMIKDSIFGITSYNFVYFLFSLVLKLVCREG